MMISNLRSWVRHKLIVTNWSNYKQTIVSYFLLNVNYHYNTCHVAFRVGYWFYFQTSKWIVIWSYSFAFLETTIILHLKVNSRFFKSSTWAQIWNHSMKSKICIFVYTYLLFPGLVFSKKKHVQTILNYSYKHKKKFGVK